MSEDGSISFLVFAVVLRVEIAFLHCCLNEVLTFRIAVLVVLTRVGGRIPLHDENWTEKETARFWLETAFRLSPLHHC
jgi:hypothetical protein